jgi:tetratricopeptide (TPR) repeat protein
MMLEHAATKTTTEKTTTEKTTFATTPWRKHGKGEARQVGNIRVLRLRGSFREMGEQHGALLRDEVRAGTIPYYRVFLEKLLGRSMGPFSAVAWPALQAAVGRRVQKNMPDFALETIAGLAEGAGLDPEEFLAGCTMPDTLLWVASRLIELKVPGPAVAHRISLGLGCTSAIAWGDATEDGKLLHARNLDYHGVSTWPKNAALLFHEPDVGMRYVSAASAGVGLGGVTAMNAAGLSLTVHQHMFTDQSKLGGTPIGAVGDIVMREAKTLDEAEAIFARYKPIGCWTYLVTDGKNGEVLCWEESPVRHAKKRFTREDATLGYANIYLDPELGRTEMNLYGSYWRHNQARHKRANDAMKASRGRIDERTVAGAIADRGLDGCRIAESTAMVMTTTSVVFKPEDGLVWVGTGEAPTSRNEFLCFSLHDQDHVPSRGSFQVEDGETKDERAAYEHYRRVYCAYVDRHDVKDALREAEAARDLAPKEPLYHALVGLCALELRDAVRARAAFDRAIALGHPHEERRASFHLHRGRAHDLLGDRREAKDDYRACLSLKGDAPVHAAARKGYAKRWKHRAFNVDVSLADVVSP